MKAFFTYVSGAVKRAANLRTLYWTAGVLAAAAVLVLGAVFVMDRGDGGLKERLERQRFRAYVDSSFSSFRRERYALAQERERLRLRRRLLAGRRDELKREIGRLKEVTGYFREKERE